ncbi:hypothetical protein LCGC14_2262860, partial [marine sediment metagenome]
ATTDKASFMAGLTTRANFYNNLIIIYGVNFFELVRFVFDNLSCPAVLWIFLKNFSFIIKIFFLFS